MMLYAEQELIGEIHLRNGTARLASPMSIDSSNQRDVFFSPSGTSYVTDAYIGSRSNPIPAQPAWQTTVVRRQLVNKRIHEVLSNKNAPTDIVSLSRSMELVLTFIKENGPEYLSLKNFDSNEVQPEHLASVLATTAGWKDQIQGWHESLKVAIEALEKARLDPRDALYGLI